MGDFQKEQEKFVQEKNAKKTGMMLHKKYLFVHFCIFHQSLSADAAVPPWVGYNEEETIQQQILALSAVSFRSTSKSLDHLIILDNVTEYECFIFVQDKRNFLRDPPAGVQFHFDFEQMYPVALVMLQEDELLNRMRFDLVPKQWDSAPLMH